MDFNRKIFFDYIRPPIFNGSIGESAVANIGKILDHWFENHAENPPAQLAYVLATVFAEVGRNMAPVRESFADSDEEARQKLRNRTYAAPAGPHDHSYYGRGYVQLTWLKNYQRQSDKLGIDFVKDPDKVLETENALKILVEGMLDGDFNGEGHGLSYYVNDKKQDFVEARRTVNVQDRAHEIAGYARAFLAAIEAAANGIAVSERKEPSVKKAEKDREREYFLSAKQQEKLAVVMDDKLDIPFVSDGSERQIFLKIVQSIDRNVFRVVPEEIVSIVNKGDSVISPEVYQGMKEYLASFLGDIVPVPFLPGFIKREILEYAIDIILRALSEFTTIDDLLEDVLGEKLAA
ncbi:hypothetical protein GR183_01685 [Stappia sp. GBMRC 2046]|uniref:Glycoside hydrolase family 19 catalytic domain-containing protein n=1 Tax=Stappia sediminis TaxID=2692190 RepID=A0A7X3S612_9HYPH|nr:hypothetical protein [Stappia sediminis]MXN63601.1 hypothetical protein [Stappia sediminis]